MTREEFAKLPFRMVSRESYRTEHCTVYENREHGIMVCVHNPVDPDTLQRRPRASRHFKWHGRVFKSLNKFLEAYNDGTDSKADTEEA